MRIDYSGYTNMDISVPLPDAESRYMNVYLERCAIGSARIIAEGTNFRAERH